MPYLQGVKTIYAQPSRGVPSFALAPRPRDLTYDTQLMGWRFHRARTIQADSFINIIFASGRSKELDTNLNEKEL